MNNSSLKFPCLSLKYIDTVRTYFLSMKNSLPAIEVFKTRQFFFAFFFVAFNCNFYDIHNLK